MLAQILTFVEQLLNLLKEFDAANIIGLIKDFIAGIM